ncbi:hypothetical protein GR160_11680 [Flavobacterium sp. Sd200]|uniref:DUF7660 family protein n=1 Tax=Flavobacterium sp. Sd200 TaxID=2692211 RepID=UPI001367C5F8|nr:hypothetical protein [Flavobacterium sp. Sd200]MXN91883.1 hypothetical protein [Flavobacterium sp. Sd200]
MSTDLHSIEVKDRKSFARFLELLHEDLTKNPTEWENIKLTDFLEAMTRYTEDIQGYYDNTNQEINADEASWKVFADILMGSTIYE